MDLTKDKYKQPEDSCEGQGGKLGVDEVATKGGNMNTSKNKTEEGTEKVQGTATESEEGTEKVQGTATESEEGSEDVQGTATESEEGSEEKVTDTDDDIDWGDWDYVPDESCDPYYCPQSQPCFCIRGVSYTPPGWVRKYKK